MDRVTSCPPVAGGADTAGVGAGAGAGADAGAGAGAGAGADAGAASALKSSLDIESVSKALDWWAAKSAEIDQQLHRTMREGRRCADRELCFTAGSVCHGNGHTVFFFLIWRCRDVQAVLLTNVSRVDAFSAP